MLTLQECRQLLPPHLSYLTDKDLNDLRTFLYKLARLSVEATMNQLKNAAEPEFTSSFTHDSSQPSSTPT